MVIVGTREISSIYEYIVQISYLREFKFQMEHKLIIREYWQRTKGFNIYFPCFPFDQLSNEIHVLPQSPLLQNKFFVAEYTQVLVP